MDAFQNVKLLIRFNKLNSEDNTDETRKKKKKEKNSQEIKTNN